MELKPLIDAIRNSVQFSSPFDINGNPAVFVPQGFELKTYPDPNKNPDRINRAVEAQSIDAFIDYFQRFADENSTIFVDYNKQAVRGFIDYHCSTDRNESGEPTARHCTHTVNYTFKLTPEAIRWIEASGKRMTQADFALFIEDGAPEIIVPSAAEMLEVATTLSAKTNVDFKSHMRLDNGQVQFQFNEMVQGMAGAAGSLSIPTKISLGIQLFRGSDRYQIDANFRFRLEKGQIVLWFDLIRPNLVIDDAVSQVRERLEAAIDIGHILEATI